MNLGHLWICVVGISPSNDSGAKRKILPHIIGNSPALSYMLMGNLLVMEYNSRAWEYCLVISVKDLCYSDNHSGHQIYVNNFPSIETQWE